MHSIRPTLSALLILPLPAEEPVDLSIVNRIKNEAFSNSQAMERLF